MSTNHCQAQTRLFGRRFAGASLSEISLGEQNEKKVSDWLKSRKNMLVFLGAPGTGKTHLCASLIPYAMDNFNSYRYWSERELLLKLRESMDGKGDYVSELKYNLDDELVMIDDLGSSGITEWRREVLFAAVDIRYGLSLPTLITSNLRSEDLARDYGDRFVSRLFSAENTIIEMHEGFDNRQDAGLLNRRKIVQDLMTKKS